MQWLWLPLTNLDAFSLISIDGQISFHVLQNLCPEPVGAWNFGILVEGSNSEGPSSVVIRIGCLFAY